MLRITVNELFNHPIVNRDLMIHSRDRVNANISDSNEDLLESIRIIQGNSTHLIQLVEKMNLEIKEFIKDSHALTEKNNILIRENLERNTLELSEIHKIAFIDPLTGLPNRRLLSDRLHQVILNNKRWNSFSAAIFIDLDKFKSINDTYGHDAGDELLIAVGNRLKNCLRESDTVARYGGDEFVVLLDQLDGNLIEAKKEAGAVGEKILSTLVPPYHLTLHRSSESPLQITYQINASLGITMFDGILSDEEQILSSADKAMYLAKSNGGRCIRSNSRIDRP